MSQSQQTINSCALYLTAHEKEALEGLDALMGLNSEQQARFNAIDVRSLDEFPDAPTPEDIAGDDPTRILEEILYPAADAAGFVVNEENVDEVIDYLVMHDPAVRAAAEENYARDHDHDIESASHEMYSSFLYSIVDAFDLNNSAPLTEFQERLLVQIEEWNLREE